VKAVPAKAAPRAMPKVGKKPPNPMAARSSDDSDDAAPARPIGKKGPARAPAANSDSDEGGKKKAVARAPPKKFSGTTDTAENFTKFRSGADAGKKDDDEITSAPVKRSLVPKELLGN
jgi:hypothetical protein